MIRIYFSNSGVYKLAQDNQWLIQDVSRNFRLGEFGVVITPLIPRFYIDTKFTISLYLKLISEDSALYQL